MERGTTEGYSSRRASVEVVNSQGALGGAARRGRARLVVAGASGEGDDPAAGEAPETGQANLGSGGGRGQGGQRGESAELGRAGGEEFEEGGRRGGRGSGNSRGMRMQIGRAHV